MLNMNNYIKIPIIIIFASSIFGYPLLSSIGVILNMDNRQLVVPYRGLIVLISLSLFFVYKNSFFKYIKDNKKFVFASAIFYFFFMFIFRSFLDTFFYLSHIDFNIKKEFWLFTILVTLLPSVSFASYYNNVEENKIVKYSLYMGLISVLTCLTAYLGTVSYDISMLYSGRMSLTVLNPITIGHAALSLIILSYASIIRFRSKNILIVAISFFVGFLTLIAAGSRGPFVSLFAVIIFILLTKGISFKGILYGLIFVIIINIIASSFDVYIFEVLLESLFKDEARDSIFKESFSLIKENFFLGSGIFALQTYPHNLFVESFLILGVFGFILFLVVFIMSSYYSYIMYKNNLNIIFPLLYVQYSIFYMVSGTIHEALVFWMMTFCMLTFNFKQAKL